MVTTFGMESKGEQVSISSTFYVRIFRMNVISAAFFLVTCTWKKLPKRRSYEKRAHIKLMKLTAGVVSKATVSQSRGEKEAFF